MPTSVTHQILAEEVYKELPKKISAEILSLPHFYLGAQGCDICFMYKAVSTLGDNLGQFVHAVKPLSFFRILWEESRKSAEVRSYAYGYLTHYAADTIFHPFIYDLMGGKERVLKHHAIEHAYDAALLKKYKSGSLSAYRLPAFGKVEIDGIYKVYARYARVSGWGELSKPAFRRAVKYYAAFVSFRLPWYRKKYVRPSERLFEESRARALKLLKEFRASADGVFPADSFGRHYLNGEIVKEEE